MTSSPPRFRWIYTAVYLLVAAILTLPANSVLGQPSDPPPDSAVIPATRAGNQLMWVMKCLNGQELGDLRDHVTDRYLQRSEDELREMLTGMREQVFEGKKIHVNKVLDDSRDNDISVEITAKDEAPYFHGKAVGAVVTAYGWQATGSTLNALRGIIHAMRGWPTPFGAALNSTAGLFDETGACREAKDAWALHTVAEQVVEFARMRIGS